MKDMTSILTQIPCLKCKDTGSYIKHDELVYCECLRRTLPTCPPIQSSEDIFWGVEKFGELTFVSAYSRGEGRWIL